MFLMVSTWIISTTLALIPFSTSLQYFFTTQAYIPDNLFLGYEVVEFETAKSWAEELLTFSPELQYATAETVLRIRNAASWSDLYSVVTNASIASILDTQNLIG